MAADSPEVHPEDLEGTADLERASRLRSRLPWLLAFLILAILAGVLVWYPILRTFAYFEVNFNEGWNAYRAKMAQDGVPLYGAVPKYVATNYPPLSFHFIGFLGRMTGDVVAVGRYISLISVLGIAALIAAIVRHISGRWHAGSYAAFGFVIWLAAFQSDRIGMDDPQLLATVFSLLAVYVFLVKPDSSRWLAVSAVIFAVSIFTKHNLLAFPAAVGASLLLSESVRRTGVWAGTLFVTAGVLFFLTLRIDGPYFWAHLTLPRPYLMSQATIGINRYLDMFQVPAVGAMLWALWIVTSRRASPSRMVLVLALVAAQGLAFAFSGGYGVDGNIFFDSIIVLALIMGVALEDLSGLVQGQRFGGLKLMVLLLAPFVGVARMLPERIGQDYIDARLLSSREDEFTQAVSLLMARPGSALCTNLLLCFEAGKPEQIDTYIVASQLGLGILPEDELTNLIETDQFRTIEVESSGGQLVVPGLPLKGLFGKVEERYRVVLRTGKYGLLIPNVD